MPIRVEPNTPSNTMYLASSGRVGMGTNSPSQGVLDVRSSDGSLASFSGNGTKFLHLTSNDGGGVQIRLEADSSNRRIMGMDSTGDIRYTQLIFNDTDIRFTGPSDLWAIIDETGLTTVGPTCNPGPCDRTYDPEYFQVASIEEHAASMWENRYLAAVGPTSPDQPFNVTQKVGGILHELEVAHIYIEQLNERLVALEQQVADSGSQRTED